MVHDFQGLLDQPVGALQIPWGAGGGPRSANTEYTAESPKSRSTLGGSWSRVSLVTSAMMVAPLLGSRSTEVTSTSPAA